MSNLTIFSGGNFNLPAHLRGAELDETTKNLAGSTGGGKRISIRGSVFRMMVNGEQLMVNEDRAMNVVIVAASPIGRQYYEGAYDESAPAKASACWSTDSNKPAPEVKSPQANMCMSCAQNIKGSGQGESRACRYQQRLAVLLEGDIDGDVFQLPLPATSIFGKAVDGKMPMQAYAQFMAQHKIPVGGVVTEMRFDTSSATPKLTFRAVRPLTEEEYQSCKSQGQSEAAQRAITMTVAQTDNVKAEDEDDEVFSQPAPVKAAPVEKVVELTKPKKQKEAPAPIVEEAEVEMVEEPVKVAKGDTAPIAKADLSSLIDEWDD